MNNNPNKKIKSFSLFSQLIKKVSQKREHKITNSYGVLDAYNSYKKACLKDPVSLKVYRQVIRAIGKESAKSISSGYDIYFPYSMGELVLRKYYPKSSVIEGKFKTTLAIDWQATLELWYSDEDSRDKKRLIRCETKEIFKIFYDKKKAKYAYKSSFHFIPNRQLKKQLKHNIKNNLIDAYLI